MKKILFLLSITLSFFVTGTEYFKELTYYIKNFPELVYSDNKDWTNPDYTSFYTASKKSVVDTVLSYLNLKSVQPWDNNTIKNLLDTVVLERKKYSEISPYAVAIAGRPQDKFIVWGDLFGAAHSLFRGLEYFYEQKILDDKFRIAPNCYFIFLGNVIDRSPYSLETLHMLLVLMAQNPNQVFYLKGSHERNNLWAGYSLNAQITQILSGSLAYKERLRQSINDFFDTLPEALYITQENNRYAAIRFSNATHEGYAFNETNMNVFPLKPAGTVSYIPIDKNKNPSESPEVVALIHGGNYVKDKVSTSNGLSLVEPDQGATTWSLISSPTQIYQEFFNFYYDAFAELTLGATIDQATIQLYYQDLRSKVGFKADMPFRVTSGQAVYDALKFDTAPYYIGSTLALTKELSFMGQSVQRAISVVINESNKSGGINGHSIRPVILDDKYEPSLARANVETLINKKNINTLLLPIGSPTLDAYLDLVQENKVSVLFPVTGSPVFRKKDLKSIINWRASYPQETRALVKHMVSKYASKKFAFFYQDDAYGQGAFAMAKQTLASLGITSYTAVPYNRTATDFSRQADIIKKAQPDAIGFFSTGGATEELIRLIGPEAFISTKLFGLSFLGDNNFRKFIKNLGLNVLFAQVVPNPRTNTTQLVQEFRALMDLNNYPYDIFSLEAYIGTELYLEALKNISGEATGEKIIEYFEQYKNVDYKGIRLNFNPETRGLSSYVWLETSEDVWAEEDVSDV
ncbi:MAG: ABC transporter substrate-binding protein [Candidatus Dependentiae bacterium]|nr:ABC transporter substrate-binding protein [Candidatus Dependentiae bacterium]